jgi:hypothetical protein
MDDKEYTKLKEFIRSFQEAGITPKADAAFKADYLAKAGFNTATMDRADILAALYIFADLAYANGIILEETFMDLDNNLMGYVEFEDSENEDRENAIIDANIKSNPEWFGLPSNLPYVERAERDLIRQEITASNIAAMANRSLNFRKG